LFWKRKNNWEEIKSNLLNPLKKVEKPDPELFVMKTNERRNSYRVQPSNDEPIFFRLEDKPVPVKDISAAGLSFKNENCSIGELFTVNIDLPGLGPTVPATLQIVGIDQSNRCHCRFLSIDEAARERIHQYVLNRQKEQVRERREMEKKRKSTVIPITAEPEEDPIAFCDP
jgi:hypothetical protein